MRKYESEIKSDLQVFPSIFNAERIMFQDWSDGKRFTKKSRSKTFVSIYFIFHFIYIVFFFSLFI